MGPVRRRQFLNAAGVLLAAPLASFAQQAGKVWRVGFLSPASRQAIALGAFAAHALKGRLDADLLVSVDVGVRYQM